MSDYVPKMIGIICNWCCYGGADLCGVSRFQYPPYIRLVRVMCSARVDLAHIFRAFGNGIDGVFVGGCHLNDCHYVTNGNYDALSMIRTCQRLLGHIGIDPARLRLEWVSAGEGIRFANIMNEFGPRVRALGPLGSSEGLAPDELARRIAAVERLIPYIRLVLAERLVAPKSLRAAADQQAEHEAYFASADFARLFEESIGERLTESLILGLLQRGPLGTSDIAKALALKASEVSKHMNTSSRRGLVRYDAARGRYALA